MRNFSLASPIVIDSDCLSSFLWIKKGDLIPTILEQTIFIPELVLIEVCHLLPTKFAWVAKQLDNLLASGNFKRLTFGITDPATTEFIKLTHPPKRQKPLGDGEAAVISYVRFHGGTVASNNLSDVAPYCQRHSIEFISTDDILCLGVTRDYISMEQARKFWRDMKVHKQSLPKYDFDEAYHRFKQNLPKTGKIQNTAV